MTNWKDSLRPKSLIYSEGVPGEAINHLPGVVESASEIIRRSEFEEGLFTSWQRQQQASTGTSPTAKN